MALILNIETATKNCSVCLAKDGKVLVLKEINDANYSHAEKLHPFIVEVLKEANIAITQIDAFAVSKGPGSYTGLRIGVSAAKGLCFTVDKPLISIDTLISLAHAISIENGLIIPLLDARRMEVYSAIYDVNYHQTRTIKAEIIDENSFADELATQKVYFLGDGAAKCKAVIQHKNAFFIENEFPSAKQMAQLTFEKYQKNDFEDVAYFEPFYLKNFVAGIQKKP